MMHEILEFVVASHSIRGVGTAGVTAYYHPNPKATTPEYGSISDVLKDGWFLVTVIPETGTRRTYVFARPSQDTAPSKKTAKAKSKKETKK
tara:strand:+ start:1609 stop:1881 length:273 start_codon:yes stop_codon:yes gene_type:complete